MSKIVFLNMSDTLHVDGHKAVTALKNKYPDQSGGFMRSAKVQVDEIEMVPFFLAWQAGTHSTKDLAKIKAKISSADKVMISIHGPLKSVDYALIRNTMGAGDQQVTYQELGRLILDLFDAKVCHNLTLVTCFAARSSAYQQDHRDLDQVDWSDSFAYKLFNEIAPALEVRMTARTGELSFNPASGVSEVQTERSIEGTLDNEGIQAEAAVALSQGWWNSNIGRLMGSDELRPFVTAVTVANNQGDPALKLRDLRALQGADGIPVANADRANCLAYLGHLIRLTEASGRQADPVQGKFGKLVFRYFHGVGICVFAKYPAAMLVHPLPVGQMPRPIADKLLRQFSKA